MKFSSNLPTAAHPLILLGLFVACSEDETQSPTAECGDGVVQGDEVCDDGMDNGGSGRCKKDCSGLPKMVTVEGDVLAFLTEVPGPRIEGATVTVVEHPERKVVTGADAHFRFEDLEEGSELTLRVEHPDLKTTQTATITLGPNGVNPFSVQVLPLSLFNVLANLVPLDPELDKFCAIATTVARFGGSLYVSLRQGMPGATASIDPPVPEDSGPLYFNEAVLPDEDQPSTSIDGGLLYYRVPPGDYELTATREGIAFNQVRFRCEAGLVVNAGPPLGLLAHIVQPDYAAGVGLPDDENIATTDALCEATAACVNAAEAENYPAATVASCKAMFRNAWASIEDSCPAAATLRDAARGVYQCRMGSCDTTLGEDVCQSEERALSEAELAYGACIGD